MRATAAGRAARAIAEPLVQVGARRLERRHDSEHQAGQRRDRDGEADDPPIDGRGGEGRELDRRERQQDAEADPGDNQTRQPRQDGQHQTLDEELTHQAALAGAQGEPHAHLAMAARRPDQHQVRDVGAGNQQDESDGDEQDDQGRPHTTDQLLAQRTDTHRPPGVGRGELAGDVRRNRVEIGGRGHHVDAVLEPSDEGEALAAAKLLLRGRQRVSRPDLHFAREAQAGRQVPLGGKIEPGREHADDVRRARRSAR